MKFKLGVLLAFLVPASLWAAPANIQVLKTKGRKAVVLFPEDAPPVGTLLQRAETKTEDDAEDESDEEVAPTEKAKTPVSEFATVGDGWRDNYISLDSSFAKSVDAAGTMALDFAIGFGWNFGDFELGPKLNVGKATGGALVFGGGGQIDWNFLDNRAPRIVVPGLVFVGDLSKTSLFTIVQAGTGLFVKLFVLRKSTSALRMDARFMISRISSTGSFNQNMVLSAGIETFF